jgi:hypothetical protein
MLKTKKGYIGIIFIIVIVAFALFWFFYLWNKNWFGGRLNIPSNDLNGGATSPEVPKGINTQLNDLRKDVKTLQDKKDQEIMNELK